MFGKKKEELRNKNKVCPLAFGTHLHKYKTAFGETMECIREDCMWWNPNEQDCNINVIAKRLAAVLPITR